MVGLAQPMPKKVKVKLWDLKQAHLGGSPMCQGASSTDSSIELETRATRSSSTTRPRNPTPRGNKLKMLRGEGSQAAFGRKQRAEKARRMRERMSIDEGLEYVRSREEVNQEIEENEHGSNENVPMEERSQRKRG
ncbi:unnamed protein product [Microthlaspi erraticum]|uniref:Uncharacterized protein n=1 Tax=Microthlaspi erraticum TaxID=1685480 RepID=A0A6D2K0W2_9BRAS|nr:unnamed protein product [Microthlaspi erraticum]